MNEKKTLLCILRGILKKAFKRKEEEAGGGGGGEEEEEEEEALVNINYCQL